MKSIHAILTQFETDLGVDLPDLLTAQSLPAIDEIIIGGSRDSKKKTICIYKDRFRTDMNQNSLSIIFQCQLNGINEEIASKYEDVLLNYFKQYSPTQIEMNILDFIETETFPVDQTQGTFIIFTVQYLEHLDGCDND